MCQLKEYICIFIGKLKIARKILSQTKTIPYTMIQGLECIRAPNFDSGTWIPHWHKKTIGDVIGEFIKSRWIKVWVGIFGEGIPDQRGAAGDPLYVVISACSKTCRADAIRLACTAGSEGF